jgi:hypothetical protein
MQGQWVGVGLGLLATAVIGACTADSPRAAHENAQATRAAIMTETSQHLSWGEADGQLGFRPSFRESVSMGAPAFALVEGAVLVLDAVHGRVVRVRSGDVSQLASVPVDCDDISAASDGAFAVRRSMKPEVLVFAPSGEKIGSVDTSAVEGVDGITLGASRRVFVTNGFQQTFLVGSPSMPQSKAAIQANVRDGASLLPDGSGVVGRKVGDEVELHVIAQTGDRSGPTPRAYTKARWSLGKADAIRVVGAEGGVACARLEHVGSDAAGVLAVTREAACVDLATGKTVFRRELPSPGAYLPRRELAMRGSALTFVRATGDGLDIATWPIAEGGAR